MSWQNTAKSASPPKGRYVDAAGVGRKRIALIRGGLWGVGFGNHAIPVDPVSSLLVAEKECQEDVNPR